MSDPTYRDWRYWITYEGRIQADDENAARIEAHRNHITWLLEPIEPSLFHAPLVEVEEVGEGE